MSAPYAPFMDDRMARPPGLAPLDPAAWVTLDADYAAQMAQRDALLRAPDADTVDALPEAADAVAEFIATLTAHLRAHPAWRATPAGLRRPDGVTVADDLVPLVRAGRLTQEDWLLMAPPADAQAEHRLVAGVLCFPSHWALSDKMGRALTAIHDPVPRYDVELAQRVNRVFVALRPERPLMRVNWLVTPSDRLRQSLRHGQLRPDRPQGDAFWLRTERQTLRRLPRTGVVVFGVKTTLTPFANLTPEQRAVLRRRVGDWDAADAAYRGGEALRVAAIDRLA